MLVNTEPARNSSAWKRLETEKRLGSLTLSQSCREAVYNAGARDRTVYRLMELGLLYKMNGHFTMTPQWTLLFLFFYEHN